MVCVCVSLFAYLNPRDFQHLIQCLMVISHPDSENFIDPTNNITNNTKQAQWTGHIKKKRKKYIRYTVHEAEYMLFRCIQTNSRGWFHWQGLFPINFPSSSLFCCCLKISSVWFKPDQCFYSSECCCCSSRSHPPVTQQQCWLHNLRFVQQVLHC